MNTARALTSVLMGTVDGRPEWWTLRAACERCGVEHTFAAPGPNGVPSWPARLATMRTERGFVFVCSEGGCS